jgi:hypothetical protein
MSSITKNDDGWIEAAPTKEDPKDNSKGVFLLTCKKITIAFYLRSVDEGVDNITSQMGEMGTDSAVSNLLKSTYEVTVSTAFKALAISD